MVPDVLDSAAMPAAAWGDAATVVCPPCVASGSGDRRGARRRSLDGVRAWVDQIPRGPSGERPPVGGALPVRGLARPGRAADPRPTRKDGQGRSSRGPTCTVSAPSGSGSTRRDGDDAEPAGDGAEAARLARLREHYVADERIISDCATVYALALCFGRSTTTSRTAAASTAEVVAARTTGSPPGPPAHRSSPGHCPARSRRRGLPAAARA